MCSFIFGQEDQSEVLYPKGTNSPNQTKPCNYYSLDKEMNWVNRNNFLNTLLFVLPLSSLFFFFSSFFLENSRTFPLLSPSLDNSPIHKHQDRHFYFTN